MVPGIKLTNQTAIFINKSIKAIFPGGDSYKLNTVFSTK